MDVILTGACGRMGTAIAEAAGSFGIRIVAGVDRNKKPCGFPIYDSLSEVTECADLVIDFSSHLLTNELCAFLKDKKLPAVIAPTGHTDEELKMLEDLSRSVPVFRSGNFSLGINLLIDLCRNATKLLGADADIEIVEKHHNRKLDAPSGTALMIAGAIRETLDSDPALVYDRTDRREPRPRGEIGISSVRGGNIVGEHEVLFCFGNEVLSVKHTAYGRSVFAEGALRAAKFLVGKAPGSYSMKDLLEEAGKSPANV